MPRTRKHNSEIICCNIHNKELWWLGKRGYCVVCDFEKKSVCCKICTRATLGNMFGKYCEQCSLNLSFKKCIDCAMRKAIQTTIDCCEECTKTKHECIIREREKRKLESLIGSGSTKKARLSE